MLLCLKLFLKLVDVVWTFLDPTTVPLAFPMSQMTIKQLRRRQNWWSIHKFRWKKVMFSYTYMFSISHHYVQSSTVLYHLQCSGKHTYHGLNEASILVWFIDTWNLSFIQANLATYPPHTWFFWIMLMAVTYEAKPLPRQGFIFNH